MIYKSATTSTQNTIKHRFSVSYTQILKNFSQQLNNHIQSKTIDPHFDIITSSNATKTKSHTHSNEIRDLLVSEID